jgi:peptidyl-prolyl cis-trans isomerase D
MFEYVRKHNRVMQIMLFVLIVPSFVLFGLEGYNRYNEKGEAVARVDGREITQGDWDNAHRMEVERMRQQMPTLDAKLLDSPASRYGTLERLVRDRVLAAAAEKSQLVVADQRVARELQRNELIASLRKPDGSLDMERYKQMLVSQGMTPEMYENQIRRDLATRQVLGGVSGTGMASTALGGVSLGSFLERREVQVVRFSPADFAGKVDPSATELEAFYKANPQLFQAPEQANIEYLVLDLEAVRKGITVNEQELRDYYEQNIARMTGKEERRASHILIAAGKTASPEDKAKAKAKAQELLAEVRKKPDGFAEVAKKHSQDPGSAPQGGDLDFFARGAMTKPFEDAAFALKAKGDISDVVESEFGYHIIRLTDMKVPKQRSFDEMRAELENELKKQQAQKKYAEAAEVFTNTVFEQADSLKPAAEKLKLEIRTANNVERVPPPGGAPGILTNAKFLAALFSPDATERKRNTEAMETGANQLVSGRVVQYTPARARPFAEVKDDVLKRVVAQRSAELAKKEGEAKLAAWKAAPATATLPAAVTMSRQDANKQPRPLIEAALRADPAALPAFVGVDLGGEGYAVLKVNKVLPREAPLAEQAQQEKNLYLRAWTTAEGLAYYDMLKERFKVQIVPPRPKDMVD